MIIKFSNDTKFEKVAEFLYRVRPKEIKRILFYETETTIEYEPADQKEF